MIPLPEPIKPSLNLWDKDRIAPGACATVGDVLYRTRLKQSAPDLNPRYAIPGKEGMFKGSNVQDGMWESFTTGGLGAKTVNRPFAYRAGNKSRYGWVHQDIVPVDRARDVKLAGLKQFGWKSLTTSIERAKWTGDAFTPLPGGYGPLAMKRGSQFPIVVATTGDSVITPPQSQGRLSSQYGRIRYQAPGGDDTPTRVGLHG